MVSGGYPGLFTVFPGRPRGVLSARNCAFRLRVRGRNNPGKVARVSKNATYDEGARSLEHRVYWSVGYRDFP